MRWVYIFHDRREDCTNLSSAFSILSRIFTVFQIFKYFEGVLQVLPRKFEDSPPILITSIYMAEEEIQVEEGPVLVLKWDQGLFEQITRGFRFPPEWDAQYPRQGQTAANAPPGYITLFEEFFLQGNFRLPATEFMASIFHLYGFHIPQMSPAGMVRVRYFEFRCRSQGHEPTVEKFQAFYQLIRNIDFYSFGNRGSAKKILLNPPKSFYDLMNKFFFIREEVIPIAMILCESDTTEKEELPIPKGVDWYLHLKATPNRIFRENVLVAVHMSDKWPETSDEVPVLKFEDRGMLLPFSFLVLHLRLTIVSFAKAHLYQAAFPTFDGSMGVCLLCSGEPSWYEQIRANFLYPPTGVFANPPTATEGALLPRPRPLHGVTSVGKEILYLSSEESVGSSQEELSSWSNIFAGVLRDLGIDPKDRPKKAAKKKTKRVTVDVGVSSKKGRSSRAAATTEGKVTLRLRQSNLVDYVVASDSLEGLSRIGEKKKTSTASSKSSGSAGSRISEAGVTPSSIALDEEEEEEHEEAAAKLLSRKRSREEVAAGAKTMQKNVGPALKKTPEKTMGVELEKAKEPAAKKTKFIIKPPRTIEKEVEKVVEEPASSVILEKEKQKQTETAAATERVTAQGLEVTRITGLDQPLHEKEKEAAQSKGPEVTAHKDASTAAGGAGAGGSSSAAGAFAAGQEGAGSQGSMPQAPIGPKDTLEDIYYKTYTEEARGDTPHQPVWGLKQKDTFVEFGAYRDWYLSSFPPGEVNRQRAHTDEGLYHAYIVGEVNTRATNHQIVHEWRTMVRERADWEKFRERLLKQAAFEAEKKSEEWGRDGLKSKLQAAEELLSKERAEWKKVCKKDNQHMYATCSKITDLESQITTLKGKVEEVQADKDRIESLEIDLEAERVKVDTAEETKKKVEEARDINTSTLNVAQNNYAEAQSIVETLIANSILNATEIDAVIAALIDASRVVGHRGGYLECAQHVEEAFGKQLGTHHYSVTDQADSILS
ncbi:hypothetical protein Hanom_Chr15g01403631 [Helianthus anomalus]